MVICFLSSLLTRTGQGHRWRNSKRVRSAYLSRRNSEERFRLRSAGWEELIPGWSVYSGTERVLSVQRWRDDPGVAEIISAIVVVQRWLADKTVMVMHWKLLDHRSRSRSRRTARRHERRRQATSPALWGRWLRWLRSEGGVSEDRHTTRHGWSRRTDIAGSGARQGIRADTACTRLDRADGVLSSMSIGWRSRSLGRADSDK